MDLKHRPCIHTELALMRWREEQCRIKSASRVLPNTRGKTVKAHLQVRLCLSFYTENGALLRSMSSRSQHQHQRVQRVIRNIKNKKWHSPTDIHPKQKRVMDSQRQRRSQNTVSLRAYTQLAQTLSDTVSYSQILTDTLRNLKTLKDAVRYSHILTNTHGYS